MSAISLISQYPKTKFGHLPTPLEHLPALSRHLGGPEIYIKRDDCTGLGTGGNKTRKLEYLMADALRHGATTVITPGALQSNHARQTAAAAAKLGLGCDLILERRADVMPKAYRESGNMMLNEMFGARIHEFDHGTDLAASVMGIEQERRDAGQSPYVIPMGGSNPVGALGYVECATELLGQISDADIQISHVIHATGSGGTQAGLLVGLAAEQSEIELIGIGVGSPISEQKEKVRRIILQTESLLERPGLVDEASILVDCSYIGEGYGTPTLEMNEAVLLLARLEGIICDPVYSGKALAGMLGMIRKGQLSGAAGIVFVHTGGVAGLYGYAGLLNTDAQR